MSLDLNDHRLSRLEAMIDELKESITTLHESLSAIKESLAGYRMVMKTLVALASAVGALAALLVEWIQ